jgi:hypothetical protein
VDQRVTQTQAALEARLAQLSANPPGPDLTVEEAYGPYETWMLTLGERALLLDPVNALWLVRNPVNGDWEPTGFGPGEVVFVVSGHHLGYGRVPPPLEVCPECGRRLPSGSRFCPQCGLDLVPVRLRCAVCRHDNPPAALFCARCGRRLNQVVPGES